MITREALDKFASKSNRKFKNRHKTVGASDIGQCIRKVWYMKNRTEHDADYVDGWGARKRGSIFEDHFFVPAMRAHYGAKLLYAGKEQKTLVSGNLSATPDGLLVGQPRKALAGLMVPDIGKSGEIVIEAKTIDPRVKLAEAKPEHVYQAHVQMGLLRKLTKHKPDYAVVAYTNASFFDDIVEFPVKFSQDVFDNAIRRADTIMAATSPDELKPEGWIFSGEKECEYCPFARACKRLRGAVPSGEAPAADSQFVAELTDLAREERTWSARCSEATAGQRNLQHQIKERLKEKGLRVVKSDAVNINWSAVKGRPSFDMKALREAAAKLGLDIAKFETVGDPSDRLTIQVK